MCSPRPQLRPQGHEEAEDGGRAGGRGYRQGGGVSVMVGDLISPQQDLGSTLGFSQHHYRGRETEGERVGARAETQEGWGGRMEGETLSFSVNRVPNNPFLMKPFLMPLNTKCRVTIFISFIYLLPARSVLKHKVPTHFKLQTFLLSFQTTFHIPVQISLLCK